MNNQEKIKKLLAKIEKIKKNKLDLSSDEDLSLAVMNLVSIEEHFFFTGAKTKKSKFYQLLDETREIRKSLLKKLVKNPEGEVWCLSKHLLAAAMRLMEVATKLYHQGQKKAAEDLFEKAYQLYSLFWSLNLKIIESKNLKKVSENQLNIHDQKKTGILGKLGEIVKKVIDCCKE